MVVVLDLRIGQRGLLDHRPQHRARPLVDAAVDQELADLAHDLCFGVERHGGVGPLPVADHTEALELLGLDLHPLCGEVAALAAELEHRHGVLVLAGGTVLRSEEHTSELQSLMRISYAVFCLKKKKQTHNTQISYSR